MFAGFFKALRPLTSTLIVWVVPGEANGVMSKFDGVNAVVWVATTCPSTDSVAWLLTAPKSIHTDCGCPVFGTVMLREYTASETLVKPCLYQPPPGTVIDVVAWPDGVKLHVPDRSTEAVAASPAVKPSMFDTDEARTGVVGKDDADDVDGEAGDRSPTTATSRATATPLVRVRTRRGDGTW